MDGGEQMGRRLYFLESRATEGGGGGEEEEEEEEEEELCLHPPNVPIHGVTQTKLIFKIIVVRT
jgi:hypothetical protein